MNLKMFKTDIYCELENTASNVLTNLGLNYNNIIKIILVYNRRYR